MQDRKQPVNWHNSDSNTVLEQLQANTGGLSSDEARSRLERYGPNSLPEPPRRSAILRLLRHFHNVLIYVLIASAVVTAALNHLVDTVVILAVVVVNAIIGFLQEGKAEKAMDAIREMLAPRANVLRDDDRVSLGTEALVPGDIVLLEAGDRVPADLRLLTSAGLSIQEAILTGESVPVDKQTAPVAADAAMGDRACMAFSGTLVTAGQGRGVVVTTGGETEIGRISTLLTEVQTLTTPLVRQMDVFGKWLTIVILALAAALLLFGYIFSDIGFRDLFMAVVSLSVAAIPEGLPAVLTITLAIGVQAMARRNAIVRRLPAIETLGSVSVICTDKTGTLTRNEMLVASALSADHRYQLDGSGYQPSGSISRDGDSFTVAQDPLLTQLARAAILCNDASLRNKDGVWQVSGDPMEGALLAFAGKAGLDSRDEHAAWARVQIIPFDARHRFMATLNRGPDDTGTIYVKGAPEQVLAMCRQQLTADGSTGALDTDAWLARAESVARRGQRVLAFAMQSVPPEQNQLDQESLDGKLTLLGLVGLIDPPRDEAVVAVAECRTAGIRVKMITGDHAGTAAAIGKQIGLQNPDKVLTGCDLDALDDAALSREVLDCDIFARTSPQHKLRLVTALQAHGLTIAMTGDGVNDAPALKRADAGIAMGQKGSEAAKEAADLVLADDNFASIAAAVREGRTVYDNIKKVISWALPTNAGEAMTIIVALLFGMTLPISPVQILWVNLITAITLGITLAFEPTEANTMRRPPRPRDEALLTGELAWHITLVSVLFLGGVFGIYYHAVAAGYSLELARTMALNTLVVMEIFHLFFVRNIYGTSLTWQAVRGTPIVWMSVLAVTLAQFALTYLPPLQRVFATEPVPFQDGVLIIAVGVLLFALIEIEKQIRLRLQASRT